MLKTHQQAFLNLARLHNDLFGQTVTDNLQAVDNESDDLTPLTALGLRCKTAEEFARKTPTLPLSLQTHLLPLLSPELPAPLEIIIHASILRA